MKDNHFDWPLKEIFLAIISGTALIFSIAFFFNTEFNGEKGVLAGFGQSIEAVIDTEDIENNGINYIQNMGDMVAPTIKYISGAQQVGEVVCFKELFTVTTDAGEKNGAIEDDFVICLKDITDNDGNSVLNAYPTDLIENLEEITAAFIYDNEQDLLYFYQSGAYIVQVKVYGTNGAGALYEFTIPVEVR